MSPAVQPTADEIISLTREVCRSVLELSLEAFGGDGPEPGREVMASVQITGEWQGAVSILCSQVLAETATAIMFGTEPGDVTRSDLEDAIGEIANMIGGNIKNRIPVACKLSLPTVVVGAEVRARFPGTKVTTDLRFALEPGVLGVQIHERPA